jgi:hypothetical protein
MIENQKDLRTALIRVLQNRNIGFDVAIAASEVIGSDARFNRWVATVAKRADGTVDMLGLIERYGDLVDECSSAWGRFLADENADLLRDTLLAIDRTLTALMEK